jgi:hypothetical protein
MDNDANQHPCVLCTAVLSAIAEIGAGLRGFDPHPVFAVGDQISFAGKLWYPEAMRDICGLQLEKSRLALVSSAGGHV